MFSDDQPDLPSPLDELSVGKIWALDGVARWAKRKGCVLDFYALNRSAPTRGDSDAHSEKP
jgi:hypothetical protein